MNEASNKELTDVTKREGHEPGHNSAECDKIKRLAERKRLLSDKKLCFNCTGGKHRATECRGAGTSYASKTLLDLIKIKPVRKETRRIDMMMQSVTRRIEVYNVNIASIDEKFNLQAFVSKVDKEILLSLPNPKYDSMISKFEHLKGMNMDEKEKKPSLPIHLILGNSEYSKIKTEQNPRIGKSGEPIGEFTKFRWTIMSPGYESKLDNVYLTRNSSADYEQLCSLDILGLSDNPEGDQQPVHEDFK